MALRDEGAHWRGCQFRAGSHGVASSANVNDVTHARALLHGQETEVHIDAGYQGVDKREENLDKAAIWHVAMRPGKRRALPDTERARLLDRVEHIKAKIRARVEHPFHVVKNLFGHRKACYCRLAKNGASLHALFGLANLVIARRRLILLDGQVAPEVG